MNKEGFHTIFFKSGYGGISQALLTFLVYA
jgi:hypothetical protein